MDARIHQVILKVAERCNLDCTYCYMYQGPDQSYLRRPRFMSEECYLRTLLMLRNYCDNHGSQMSVSFHGGEPTLCGIDQMDRWFTLARTVLGDRLHLIGLQTNGVLIDDEWASLFLRHRVAVGVSIDGPAEVHDAVRVDRQGRGSHAAAERALRLLIDRDLEPLALCVVQPGASGADVYRYFRSLGVERLDFLIPDVTHDSVGALRVQWGPTPVADYLVPAFDAWLAEDDPDVDIRLFHALISELAGVPSGTDAFGNRPLSYLVVESDGAIEGNDVFKVCAEGVVNEGLDVFRHSFDDVTPDRGLLGRLVWEALPLCATCQACPWVDACGGGYPPHRWAAATGFDNPSAWCDDLTVLFSHVAETCFRPAGGPVA